MHKHSLNPDYITVRCDFTADFLLGAFFDENTSQGPKKMLLVLITGTHYYDLLQLQVVPSLLEQECLETAVFMQYGAPLHTVQAVMILLLFHFKNFSDNLTYSFFGLESQ